MFLFCWDAFLSISLLASVFPVSRPLFFLFLRPCVVHARIPVWVTAFVHRTHFLAFMEWVDDIGSGPASLGAQWDKFSISIFHRIFRFSIEVKDPFLFQQSPYPRECKKGSSYYYNSLLYSLIVLTSRGAPSIAAFSSLPITVQLYSHSVGRC